MLARCKGTLLVISLLLITSCTSAEHKEALRIYELAKSSKDIQQLTIALNTLAQLAPEKYQAELAKAQKAKKLLEQAQQHQTQGDDYSAYLSSHESYRSIPSFDSKQILLSSGKVLLPLLKAQLSIDKSFQYRPKQLKQLLKQYSEHPAEHWDLIKVNTAVEQLSKAVIELNKALTHIENEEPNTNISEVSVWQSSIENQLYLTVQARNYFSNLARYHGAKKLIKLNDLLTTESIKLLSLVRPKLAHESMQTSFLKAQNKYANFQNLIANISLAENLNAKDIHAIWYKNWQSIELATLEPQGKFTNYPMRSGDRKKQLTIFLSEEKIRMPVLDQALYNKAEMNQKLPKLTKLIGNLREDKALLL